MDKEEKSQHPTLHIDHLGAKDYIDLWHKTEEVAMHFNELLLGFRLKAVGALSLAAGGLLALLTKDQSSKSVAIAFAEANPYFIGGFVFLFLTWIGLLAIDRCYYQRLLAGAAREAMRLEHYSNGMLGLSTEIVNCVDCDNRTTVLQQERVRYHPWGILLFYLLPLFGVIAWVACILLWSWFGSK